MGVVLIDLSKAFECISHDLNSAKLAAYGIERENIRIIYSHLKSRKQCVTINTIYSDYNETISGVSIRGPILFKFSNSFLFFFIEIASMYNFADNNTLSAWGERVNGLSAIGNYITIYWFTKIEMVIYPEKLRAIILDRKKSNLTNIPLDIYNQKIMSVTSVELLGINLGD